MLRHLLLGRAVMVPDRRPSARRGSRDIVRSIMGFTFRHAHWRH